MNTTNESGTNTVNLRHDATRQVVYKYTLNPGTYWLGLVEVAVPGDDTAPPSDHKFPT